MEKIRINNLVINCIIGLYEHERTKKQPIQLDIELSADISKATETDDLNDTVDYFELTQKIVDKVAETDFKLLEKLADFVVSICLQHPLVTKAKVKLTKPDALKKFGAQVSLELTRTR